MNDVKPNNKVVALVQSRRFWMAVVGVVAIAMKDTLGIAEEQVLEVAGIVIAWIIGDSLRPT